MTDLDSRQARPAESSAAVASDRPAGMLSGRHEVGPQAVRYGPGALDRLDVELDRLGARRIFLISTGSVRRSPLYERVTRLLADRCVGAFSAFVQHMPAHVADKLLASALDASPDAVVTLGGGTVTDAGKLVCFALGAGLREVSELESWQPAFRPDFLPTYDQIEAYPPLVSIPTTLSAGEYTGGFAITRDGVKTGNVDMRLMPRVVILDPEQAAYTPEWLWASTGVRAMDHAVESFIAKRTSPHCDATSVMAAQMLFENLAPATRNPEDLERRTACLVAAWLSNDGHHNSGAGLSHAIGHQLGGMFDVPHGVTSCISLAPVSALLAGRATARTAEFSRRVGLATRAQPDREAANALPAAIRAFVEGLPVPNRLRDAGVSKDALEQNLPALAHNILTKTTAKFSAITVSEAELQDLLRAAW